MKRRFGGDLTIELTPSELQELQIYGECQQRADEEPFISVSVALDSGLETGLAEYSGRKLGIFLPPNIRLPVDLHIHSVGISSEEDVRYRFGPYARVMLIGQVELAPGSASGSI